MDDFIKEEFVKGNLIKRIYLKVKFDKENFTFVVIFKVTTVTNAHDENN